MEASRLLSILSLVVTASPAGAQMLGKSMEAEWLYPDSATILEGHVVRVSDQVELSTDTILSSSLLEVDIGDDWIEFRFSSGTLWTITAFNGWRFRDALDGLPAILDYRIDSYSRGVTNTAGMLIGFNEDECWADFSGMTVAGAGDWIRFKVDMGTLGVSYCAGDGTGGPCPCGNSGAPLEGCANSSGAGCLLVAAGSTSLAADDLRFTASGLLPNQAALLFAGHNALGAGSGVFFGDGLHCAGGSVVRLGVRQAGATGIAGWGPGLGASGGWMSGDTRRFQVWYRDPLGSPCGAGFNLSNGVELVF